MWISKCRKRRHHESRDWDAAQWFATTHACAVVFMCNVRCSACGTGQRVAARTTQHNASFCSFFEELSINWHLIMSPWINKNSGKCMHVCWHSAAGTELLAINVSLHFIVLHHWTLISIAKVQMPHEECCPGSALLFIVYKWQIGCHSESYLRMWKCQGTLLVPASCLRNYTTARMLQAQETIAEENSGGSATRSYSDDKIYYTVAPPCGHTTMMRYTTVAPSCGYTISQWTMCLPGNNDLLFFAANFIIFLSEIYSIL